MECRCHPGHVLHIDSCLDRCPASTYFLSTYPNSTIEKPLTLQTTTEDVVLLHGGVGECRHCPHACKACDSSMRCNTCHNGYVLRYKDSGNNSNLPQEVAQLECATACGDGYYTEESQTGVCVKCDGLCKTCKTKNLCLSCHPNSFLTPNGSCVEECPSGYFTSLEDINQYDVIENEDTHSSMGIPYTNFRCKDCHSSCANCSGTSSNECLSCKPGLAWNILTKSCHPCDPGRYFDTSIHINQCQNCHNDCALCHGSNINECDKCKPPLRKDNWNKTCVPCCGSAQEFPSHKIQSVMLQQASFSSLPTTSTQKGLPKYCCQCDKHFNCISPSYEEKLDDGSGKRSIFMGNVGVPSMVSASRRTLMLLSVFVIICFVSFVIFKRWKRELRRRKGQGNGKRKHLAEQLVSLFSSSWEKKDGGNKRHRNGGLYSYRQVPTNSFRDSIPSNKIEDLDDSDSEEEYDCNVGRTNGSRNLHNLYNGQQPNSDSLKLFPVANSTRNKEQTFRKL